MIKICKYIIPFLLCFIVSINSEAKKIENVTWKHGIAIINGEAKYIDPSRLDQTRMIIAKSYIEKYKKANVKIIKAGVLGWGKKYLFTYDTDINKPYFEKLETETRYNIKIKQDVMYLSKDDKEWSKLEIKIVDEKPKQRKGKFVAPIYMIIYLKCKWFEGEYEIIGASD
jgi:hypothetical protein